MNDIIEKTCSNEQSLLDRIGSHRFPAEYAGFGFYNELTTLGRSLFSKYGIEVALASLVAMDRLEKEEQKRFSNRRGDHPSLLIPPRIEDVSPPYFICDDEVTVYFRDFAFQIENPDKEKRGRNRGPWFKFMHEDFVPKVRHLPDTTVKYYSKSGENTVVTRDLKNEPYQISVDFFNGALKAFSCFVNGDISFNSHRYMDEPNYERFAGLGSNVGVWTGRLNYFLATVGVLERAIGQLNGRIYDLPKGDVKLVHPKLGMIIMRGETRGYTVNRLLQSEPSVATDPKTLILGPIGVERLKESFERGF